MQATTVQQDDVSLDALVPPASRKVHIFYYGWYGTPTHDGDWFHWDQEVLDESHRRPDPAKGEIGSTHWPEAGLYSSADEAVVARHCRQMRAAGAGVVVVSWYPPGRADQKAGRFAGFQDRQVPMLAVAAVRAGLELAFHAEPYPGRTAAAAAADVELLCERHGALPGVHRRAGPRGLLPLVYVYDSYLVGPREWAAQLGRGLPAYLLGLAVERAHLEQLRAAGFDGAYSYFASDGFVWGSTAANWPEMGRFCRQHGLMWVPCAGPGYDDTRVRPWNGRTTRERRAGAYFDEMLAAAAGSDPTAVGVTSFNEWHEGTQLEPAVPRPGWPDYAPLPPDGYLRILRRHADTLQ